MDLITASVSDANLILFFAGVVCAGAIGYIIGRATGRQKGRQQVLEEFPSIRKSR